MDPSQLALGVSGSFWLGVGLGAAVCALLAVLALAWLIGRAL
jgi:hypothetical protein